MTELNEDEFEYLVRNAVAAADVAVIGFSGTGAAKTQLAVTTALRCLIENGLIEVRSSETWPAYIAINPSYRPYLVGGSYKESENK